MEIFLMTAGRGGIEDLVLPPLPRDIDHVPTHPNIINCHDPPVTNPTHLNFVTFPKWKAREEDVKDLGAKP